MSHSPQPELFPVGNDESPLQYNFLDAIEVIEECLQDSAKDGLSTRRFQNVENCFW